MPQHEFIIIGGGLGGLLCGAILAKNGINVGIVDQNKQIGGCLQSFSIQKHLFDSCVHYIGGLDKGNTLDKIFKYTEVTSQIELISYPEHTVDKIYFGNNKHGYAIAQGYQNFIDNLVKDFPNSENDLIH